MLKIIGLTFFLFGFYRNSLAQDYILPDKIIIEENIFKLYNTPDSKAKYTLILKGDVYSIKTNITKSNKTIKNEIYRNKLNKNLVKNIISTLNEELSDEIQIKELEKVFTIEKLNYYFKKEEKNNIFYNYHQKSFLINELTSPNLLSPNISSFLNFLNDKNGCKFGKLKEVKIRMYFKDKLIYSIKNNDYFKDYLYFEINGEKKYSHKLSKQLIELFQNFKINSNNDLDTNSFFSSVVENTIFNNKQQMEFLESKNYQIQIDSLMNFFKIKEVKVLNNVTSVNWNDEKRLICKLLDTTVFNNIYIKYSTKIENEKIIYPVYNIIKDYKKLLSLVLGSNFFREYLEKNNHSQLSIIYDDNSSFNKSSIKIAREDCPLLNTILDFNEIVFIDINDDFGGYSRWGLFPNNKYFLWYYSGDFPNLNYDENYLKCK